MISVMMGTTVSMMMEQMHQGTGREQQERECTKQMGPVLSNEEVAGHQHKT